MLETVCSDRTWLLSTRCLTSMPRISKPTPSIVNFARVHKTENPININKYINKNSFTSNVAPQKKKSKSGARHRLAIFFSYVAFALNSVRWSRHLVIHWGLLGNLMYWFCQRSRVRDWLWLGKVLAPLTHPTWGKLLCELDVLKKF